MTQLSSHNPRMTAKPRSNVYTVLLVVAAVALAVGAGYLYYQAGQVFETPLFQVDTSPTG